MPHTTASTLYMQASKQRPPCEEVWHLWSVLIPRRSITERLVWGTVLRRRDDDRWIYRKYIQGIDRPERSARGQWLAWGGHP